MNIYTEKYLNLLEILYKQNKNLLSAFDNKGILVSGATGMINSLMIDLLMKNNNTRIYCIVRNTNKALERFILHKDNNNLAFVEADLCNEFDFNQPVDYVIHGASPADPGTFLLNPIDTIMINIKGTDNLLKVAVKSNAKFLLMSSGEIYGNVAEEIIKEDNKGSINTLDVRSSYNESKRCSETLCVSYGYKYNAQYNIVRISRAYGPTMKLSDKKALSQFMFNGLKHEDIILKSKGNQRFSYTFASDVVTAILTVLLNGVNGEAYNIASDDEGLSLYDIANIIAKKSNTEVKIILPPQEEQMKYSKAVNSILDNTKLKEIGWNYQYGLNDGLNITLDIIKELI
ncbi:MAG: NAD-dependent epimerase/dehydratase family protein [Acholeplasmatales bacterium]|nr:NAD-dependent epimerase/dehydratase family protein [Acholeplasmatales bacterium]